MFSALPNLHPLLVHFPVALFSAALLFDLSILSWLRVHWLDRAALLSYGLAAASSVVTALSGKLAVETLRPRLGDDALAVVNAHSDWAFLTVLLFFGVFFLRLEALWRDREAPAPRAHRARVGALALALLAEWSVLTTAARGGELVYRHGVGVSRLRSAEGACDNAISALGEPSSRRP